MNWQYRHDHNEASEMGHAIGLGDIMQAPAESLPALTTRLVGPGAQCRLM